MKGKQQTNGAAGPSWDKPAEASNASILDPDASDCELLGFVVAAIARLSKSQDPAVVQAVRQVFPLVHSDSFVPMAPKGEGRGRRMTLNTEFNAVAVSYLHRLLRYRSGHNLVAAISASGRISYPEALASDAALLPPLGPDTIREWFSVIWRMILHDYRGLPCMPAAQLNDSKLHNLHALVFKPFLKEQKALENDFRVIKKREANSDEKLELARKAATTTGHILRYNLLRAFRRVLEAWASFPALTRHAEDFSDLRQNRG